MEVLGTSDLLPPTKQLQLHASKDALPVQFQADARCTHTVAASPFAFKMFEWKMKLEKSLFGKAKRGRR
jgi:hypothetical protein